MNLGMELGLLWHLLASIVVIFTTVFFVKARQKNLSFEKVWKPVFWAQCSGVALSKSQVVRLRECIAKEISGFENVRGCEVMSGNDDGAFSSVGLQQLLKISLLSESEFLKQFPQAREKKVRIVYEDSKWCVQIAF